MSFTFSPHTHICQKALLQQLRKRILSDFPWGVDISLYDCAGKGRVESLLAAETKVTAPSPFRSPAQKQWNITAAQTNMKPELSSEANAEDQALQPIVGPAAKFSPAKGRAKRKANS